MPVEAAEKFYAEQRRIAGKVLVSAAQAWGDQPPADFDAWFAENSAAIIALIVAAQVSLVDLSGGYVDDALTEQHAAVAPDADVDASGLIGVAGDGRALESLMYGAVIHARAVIAKHPDPTPAVIRDAWAESGRAALLLRAQTVLADTSRVATGLHIISRPGIGYTRMLVGTSCSRCAVLAGRTYRSEEAFDRHPGCDCRHVPARASELDAKTVDAGAYFRSLSEAEQDKRFTKAGAQAIRDGADPAQVVNARRGAGLNFASGRITDDEAAAIRAGRPTAQDTTLEGTTRRGLARKAMATAGLKRQRRLMPEAIYQAAGDDRDLALTLLRDHGYILDDVVATRRGRGGAPSRPTRSERAANRRRPTSSSPGGPGGPGGTDRTGFGDFDDARRKYRATPAADRHVDPQFADRLGPVLDAVRRADDGPAMQLARDLSGIVTGVNRAGERADFLVDWTGHDGVIPSFGAARVTLRGTMSRNGIDAGTIERTFYRDDDDRIVVSNNAMMLYGETDKGLPDEHVHQGRGFAGAFAPMMENYYRASEVDRIYVHAALEGGGYAWARQGFGWDPDHLDDSVQNVASRLQLAVNSAADRAVVTEVVARLIDRDGRTRPALTLPSPRELADLSSQDNAELGKNAMRGANWYGVKHLGKEG